MDESKQLIQGCQELGTSIDEVQKQMQSFFSMMPQQIDSSFTLQQQAKLHLINAYAVSSLAYMYLKLKGVDLTDHSIKQELDRVKSYFKKVKEATEPREDPNMRLNTGAAQRFIQHALSPTSAVTQQISQEQKNSTSTKSTNNNNKTGTMVLNIVSNEEVNSPTSQKLAHGEKNQQKKNKHSSSNSQTEKRKKRKSE